MKIKDIARKGLKGRRKDTFLITAVITLALVFIITAVVFQTSSETTKKEQTLDLYGDWQLAYLSGDKEINSSLKDENFVEKAGTNIIIGESEDAGVVGTFDKGFLDIGRLSLYDGKFPEKADEIALEINQMSKMGLELETGQKVELEVAIDVPSEDLKSFLKRISKDFRNRGYESNITEQRELMEEYGEIYDRETETHEEAIKRDKRLEEILEEYYKLQSEEEIKYYKHHDVPFEKIGDISLVISNDYTYYYAGEDDSDPDEIREKGFLGNQKVKMKKEFIVTGILDTYSDKWDTGSHRMPNAFINKEAGDEFIDAFKSNSIEDFSDYKFQYNTFLNMGRFNEDYYKKLSKKYPNTRLEDDSDNVFEVYSPANWIELIGSSDEEIDKYFKEIEDYNTAREEGDVKDKTLEVVSKDISSPEEGIENLKKNNHVITENEKSTDNVLIFTIMGIIFTATALAIFQIFLTQMKRRSRKIVLLRSIGATNMQIVKLILYEAVYFLRNALLIGVPVGLVSSVLVIKAMNVVGKRDLILHINPKLVILSIGVTILSVFVGIAIPMLYAIKIPLVGTMSKPPKHKGSKKNGEVKYQDFARINLEYLKVNKKKTFISFLISFAAIMITLSSIFLWYYSFKDYRQVVLKDGRPDYAMESIYGASGEEIEIQRQDLKGIEKLEGINNYKVGKNLYLWYEGIGKNKFLNEFENSLPDVFKKEYFSKYDKTLEEFKPQISDAFISKIYGIDVEEELFKKYRNSLSKGEIDPKKFEEGEEVIILSPLYLPGNPIEKNFTKDELLEATNEDDRMNYIFEKRNLYKQSYRERFKDFYKSEATIKVGDTIYLSSDREVLSSDQYDLQFNTEEAKVGGIINYFPKSGDWPFSNSKANYIVISSIEGMENVYPGSTRGLGNQDIDNLKDSIEVLYPNKYGRTLWYIDSKTKFEDPVLDAKLLGYAHNNNYTLHNYKLSNSKLYREGLNNALVIALLGFTAVSISLVILYNIILSRAEQDRNRIGILQSLGVTSADFKKEFLKEGLVISLSSFLMANISLFIIFLLTTSGIEGVPVGVINGIKDIFTYRLWLYPWIVHIVFSVVLILVISIIFYIPARKTINDSPINNIRSLRR